MHVFAETEDGRPIGVCVATNTLENGRPVVDHMRHHMELGFVPPNQLAVVPDLLSRLNCHAKAPSAGPMFFFRTPAWATHTWLREGCPYFRYVFGANRTLYLTEFCRARKHKRSGDLAIGDLVIFVVSVA